MKISRRSVLKSAAALPVIYNGLNFNRAFAYSKIDGDSGVASGSPTPDGFIIWTRVPSFGVSGLESVEVSWEINSTPEFKPEGLIQSGTVSTGENKDFTVKVRVNGLNAYTTYYYRFKADSYTSVIGRARTAPHQNADLETLSFGVVNCQKYSDGYYNALTALLSEDVDFCVHLGDHIYEKETGKIRINDDPLKGNEAITLADYRIKYRHYLTDPAFRAVRQKFTWIDLLDDHEVFNDYAGDRDRVAQKLRVAAAYQAFTEYMPVDYEVKFDERGAPGLDSMTSLKFGSLIEFFKMDQRQFRMPNPCDKTFFTTRCKEAEVPEQSMLGSMQKAWLKSSLESSTAKWKLLLSEVMLTPLRVKFMGSHRFANLDAWDGYPAEREEILEVISQNAISNVVALTGDIHAAVHGNLLRQGQAKGAKPTAYEIVTASITSSTLGDRLGGILGGVAGQILANSNPHVDWSDIYSHGYSVISVSKKTLTSRHMKVSTIESSHFELSEAKRLVLEDGFNI